jgi:hypothetical protein
MGAVVIGLLMFFCIYIVVIISLCIMLVSHILTNTKKAGFLKAFQSKRTVSLIVLILVCGSIPPLLFVWSITPRSGNQLFKDFILNPVPESVKVLDSFDGSPNFYPDECLHFKISPADFQLILASKNWKTVSDTPIGSLQCELGNAAWNFNFPPPLLGNNVIIYTFIPQKHDIEIMFTNAQMNEVYYFYYDGDMP